MTWVVPYAATLVAFACLDVVWLGFVANRFYRAELGGLMAETFNFPAAIAFYLIYALGVVIFAVAPAATWRDAAMWGGLFGFFAYATYDLTNLATLKDWPWRLTFVDLLWGACLTAMVAGLAHALTRAA